MNRSKISADTIATIIELRTKGHTYQEIADHLTFVYVASPRGGKWNPATVRNAYLRATTNTPVPVP